ncbi:MAG: single-stranded-DNA-specific exonuclease RecJ [Candidatus Taylorbacteria bacterium CG10_big_fil_rev_8_21_14_0_10_41_48]|uniref:Single-stranded-DNA-specific exonuclease RecJ n=1 Tax=Candidatus Taylorbacteria bacterium CG10_big_fil_rev_8_21_14_0_10_41_48 TaxID=1975024 RepID=A0A2M8LD62_9BACT|nr:MAG: single-stranded-DNA-specific exonuclease RecJ [Candidatus Taylorbacteria bacterium CG10_big_fil_rev_8_21_14_0_10_41_48]
MGYMKYRVRDIPTEKPTGFSDLVANLLGSRGIKSDSEAQAFISPDYETHTHDPFLMKDMDKVVDRIYRAVKSGDKIIIFSDYDADGIPGGVVLHDLFKKIGYANFENYIPHRHDEGFGLNEKAIAGFSEKKVNLLITIDCGIADIDKVALAESLSIDVIVTDHHLPHGALPPAYAILNPKQEGCTYPEKMLCGAGVIFKCVQAFVKKYGTEFDISDGWEKWLLDMVGIATLSDMVPLTGENRVFAYYGLKVLRKTRRPGLVALYNKLRIRPHDIVEDDIGFSITPRINAASRMGRPEDAFKLLATDSESEAGSLAETLEHVNNERKGTVASLVKEIRKIMSERDFSDKHVIVIGNPSWRPALLGLAANSFAGEYNKPVFLWGRDGEGCVKGSCRSGGGVSVFALMENAHETFSDFGGHGASGGFSVAEEAIHHLEDALNEAYVKAGHISIETEDIADADITLDRVTWETYRDIEALAPYGTGNEKPLFVFRDSLISEIKAFGKEKNHTEILFSDSSGRKLSAIQFFVTPASFGDRAEVGKKVDFVGHMEKSNFKRYPELRLRIVDIL